MHRDVYPRIEVEGGPAERGRQYGEAARERVQRSVEAYGEVFAHYAGWDWARVRAEAAGYRGPVEAYEPRYLEEMDGLAAGAAVDPLDVLAINVRTEIMFAATARELGRLPAECTSFAAVPSRTAQGELLVGQNWDWLPHAADTTVILEARQDDGPDFVTVVEAGLLAKVGMNSAGMAIATNALVTAADQGRPGVPYHVLLRALHDAETPADTMTALGRRERSSSANYLVAHADGIALDVEAAPGDYAQLFVGYPEHGVILHTNHFANPGFDGRDVGLVSMSDSVFRLMRARQVVAEHPGPLDREFFERLLADHAAHPHGVCCHPDPRLQPADQSATLASVIMEPATRRLWIAAGTPCAAPFELLDYGGWLDKPPAVRQDVRAFAA
jgi:isopenicillin-N N-acyltransferase like protein